MNLTTDDLFLIIGQQQAEIIYLRQQLASLQRTTAPSARTLPWWRRLLHHG